MQYSTDVRDAQNDAAVARIGASPTLEIRSGPPAANCAAPASGELLARGQLPAVWVQPSQGGVLQMAGEWELRGAMDASTGKQPGNFRFISADGVCRLQGSYGPQGEMVPTQPTIAIGQRVQIKSFSITRGSA